MRDLCVDVPRAWCVLAGCALFSVVEPVSCRVETLCGWAGDWQSAFVSKNELRD